MKGLLIKDFYTIFKQLKMTLFIIIIFAFLPRGSSLGFIIMYATMLPIMAVSYDERAKWNKLAAMMPYSSLELVLSKYLFGYIVVFLTTVISCLAQAAVGIFTHTPLTGEFFMRLALLVCAGLIIDAIEYPLIIKLGAEKGRLFLVIFVVIFVFAGMLSIRNQGLDLNIVLVLCVLAAVVLNAVSIQLSVKFYESNIK